MALVLIAVIRSWLEGIQINMYARIAKFTAERETLKAALISRVT